MILLYLNPCKRYPFFFILSSILQNRSMQALRFSFCFENFLLPTAVTYGIMDENRLKADLLEDTP